MIRTIAAKEILTSFKTVRFVVVMLVCCLLTPISVWVLSNDYHRETDDYQGRLELEERRTAGKQTSITVNRPVPQLSALYRGISLKSINSINLKIGFGWNMPMPASTQSVTHSLFPTVDLTFIIGVVLSVLALMMSFDAICGEKADSTLRLLMSNSVSRSSIVIGKWIGLSLAVFMPFVVGFLISLLIFFTVTGVQLDSGNWIALGLSMLAAFLYIVLFVLIGVVISAFSSNPSASIFIGLAVWGLLIIVLPQTANAVSDILSPTPATQEIEKNLRFLYNDFANSLRNTNMEMVERAEREGWDLARILSAEGQNMTKASIDSRMEMDSMEREFWLQVAEQEQLGKTFSLISPYSSLTHVLISLADTGPEVQREFLTQAYRYGIRYFSDTSSTPPKFEFEGLSLGKRFEKSAIPIAVLFLMNLVLAFVGIIAFNRYDVR